MIAPAPDFKWNEKQKQVRRMLGGPQTHTLVYGGGRSGKTFMLCHAVIMRAMRAPLSNHFIIRHRFNAVVRSIGGDNGTLAKVFRLCYQGLDYKVDKTQWFYTLPNGSVIWLLGLDEKERAEKILGLEASTIYFNEASQLKYSARSLALSRLVEKAKIQGTEDQYLKLRTYTDLNPVGKSHWSYKQFIEKLNPDTGDPLPNPDNYAWDFINPKDNLENLSPEALQELEALPERERLRFFEGVFTDDLEGALFKYAWIADHRVASTPDLNRVVVSYDPSGSAAGDECGIIVAGRAGNDFFVGADRSGHYEPDEAARVAIRAYDEFEADALVWETNYGKGHVEAVLRATAREMHRKGERQSDSVNLQAVTAFRGKVLRAEPVANLYSLGVVHHAQRFQLLEDQMTSFTADYDREENGSPDRLDALVMAITDLENMSPSSGSALFGRVRIGGRR